MRTWESLQNNTICGVFLEHGSKEGHSAGFDETGGEGDNKHGAAFVVFFLSGLVEICAVVLLRTLKQLAQASALASLIFCSQYNAKSA